MTIENMTVSEIAALSACLSKRDDKKKKDIDGGIRIVVLQRGWIAVGRYSRSGNDCKLRNGYIIRKWGTTEGLPEIAMKGPLENTILDKSPDMEFHRLTVVLEISCEESKWSAKCPL